MTKTVLAIFLALGSPPSIDEFCLVATTYGEARSESSIGQAMVAKTILNRAARQSWPTRVCDVVVDEFQYEGYGKAWPRNARELVDWQGVKQVVQAVTSGNFQPGECGIATHFHTADSNPSWKNKLRRLCRIDNHIFYVEE